MNTPTLPAVSRIGRPADRQDLIVQEIREQIVAGRLSPGSRLPTRDEIGQKYGAGANTVQRALDRLRQDGFIHSSGRNGTHVSVEPPHLCRYALVFPGFPGAHWVRFWTALSQEAVAFQRESALQLPAYYGIVGGTDHADISRLVGDVENHRVAGLIFMSPPQNLHGTALLDQPNIPRVAITDYSEDDGMPAVGNDNRSLLDRSLQALAASGRKRLAVFHGPGWLSKSDIEKSAVAHGFEIRPYWNLRVSLGDPYMAREYAHLLFNSNQNERPDALLIADDNLTEFVLEGVADAGVETETELSIITHCNFTHSSVAVPNVRRIGFDARAVLRSCVESVNRQRSGLPVDKSIRIPALFEDEISYLQDQS